MPYVQITLAPSCARAGTMRLDGLLFDGVFLDDYPTTGSYTDKSGGVFLVEMKECTHLSKVKELGDKAFKSKIQQVVINSYKRIYICGCVQKLGIIWVLWINAQHHFFRPKYLITVNERCCCLSHDALACL